MSNSTPESTSTNIRNVEPDTWLRLRAVAVRRNVKLGELLNQILREWLERNER